MKAVELAVETRILDDNSPPMDIPFDLQQLKYISEPSETLFSSYLQAGYHVNCVPGGNWVHCDKVPKETWS